MNYLMSGSPADAPRYELRLRAAPAATAIPITAMIGPRMDQVVVLLIGLPPTTPKPCSAARDAARRCHTNDP